MQSKKPVTSKGRILTLGEVIQQDVRLAAALVQLGHIDEQSGTVWVTGGWELINVVGTWTDLAANQMIEGDSGGVIDSDLWLRSIKHTVQRPNAFAGSILKAQSDYYNSLNPNINLQLIINSYCNYLISPDFTPLENLGERFESDCPAGLVLKCGATIEANYTNLRALAADENPTIATVTLSLIRLPPGLYQSCNHTQAVQLLKSRGLLDLTE
jgi:hypothetical protein